MHCHFHCKLQVTLHLYYSTRTWTNRCLSAFTGTSNCPVPQSVVHSVYSVFRWKLMQLGENLKVSASHRVCCTLDSSNDRVHLHKTVLLRENTVGLSRCIFLSVSLPGICTHLSGWVRTSNVMSAPLVHLFRGWRMSKPNMMSDIKVDLHFCSVSMVTYSQLWMESNSESLLT